MENETEAKESDHFKKIKQKERDFINVLSQYDSESGLKDEMNSLE